MGQKIHPTGFRLAVTRNWSSRWYANDRDFADMLAEDIKVREYLKTKLKNASVSRVLIERPAKNARITIYSARPGVVIGKKGEDIENLKKRTGQAAGRAGCRQHRRSAQARNRCAADRRQRSRSSSKSGSCSAAP
jgi:small subunit ribosomal protein S3